MTIRRMLLAIFITAMALALSPITPAQAQTIDDRTPYYMCFAYTPDGMFFAGGNFRFSAAKYMLLANCGMPKSIKVVLVKTIMAHTRTQTIVYASGAERSNVSNAAHVVKRP